jgi:hypothetical protein
MGGALGDAVRMATKNPGRLVGGRGVLPVGDRGYLVLFTMNEAGKHTIHKNGRGRGKV